jgi:preprotein translocase subunit SecA
MLQVFNKFIDANEREVKRLSQIVLKINEQEKNLTKLTDAKLKEKAEGVKKEIQKLLSNGEAGKEAQVLSDHLVEVFALVREASNRKLKKRHFDVQMMAGIALHDGKIAQQYTGEGKTLTATLPVSLNAMVGKGVHVVTVNDYLARRDCGWNGPVFDALGLTVAVIIHEASYLYDPKYSDREVTDSRLKHLRPVSRKEAYSADITYGTNNEFGFDYLRDNMAISLKNKNQRGHHFAIVDEVDSILIDEARTPLIISSPAAEATDKYITFSKIVDTLQSETDYVIDEKQRTANLTDHGIIKIEKAMGVDNLYEKDFASLHHIEEALKAKTLFLKDRDYVVKEGEVIIVDEFTGLLRPKRGLKFSRNPKLGPQFPSRITLECTKNFQE